MKNFAHAAIIGAGPAGIAAAIQLKRCGINFHIFEKSRIGGLLNNANCVENYPGFSKPLSGKSIVSAFEKHLDKFHIKITKKEVISVSFNMKFVITASDDDVYFSDYLIIATGTKPKVCNLFPENTSVNERFHYEIVELLDMAGKHFVIIGAGDAAFDYALNLSINNKITILNRGEEARCLDLLYNKAINNTQIKYHSSTQIDKISINDDKVLLTLNNPVLNQIECDHIIAAIGRKPSIPCKEQDMLNKMIKSEKVFLAGDVLGGEYRQAVIAAGEGLKSAMKIVNKIKNKNQGK